MVADAWRAGATAEEQFARLRGRAGSATDGSGRFIAEAGTMHACLANLPALLVVGIPLLVGETLMHEAPGLLRRGRTLFCVLLCTGVGCGRPTLREVSLLTPVAGGRVRALRRAPRFTGVIEKTRTTPDGHVERSEIATHDAGDVVLRASDTPEN